MDPKLTALERAAIIAIAAEVPDYEKTILSQFDEVRDVVRENSGVGFFCTFKVSGDPIPKECRSPTGFEVCAEIVGLKHPIGLLLFFAEDGRASMLEGYTVGEDVTSNINFSQVRFRILPNFKSS